MNRARLVLKLLAAIVATTTLWSWESSAQSQRIRGEVESVAGNAITVKTHDGKTAKVVLEDGYTVNHAVVVKLADLTPGTFVGVGAVPDGDGMKAAQVQVFAPTSSARARHGEWGSDPSGTMTNAPVTAVVAGQRDGTLTLTVEGKNYDIKVPADVPVMKTQAGTKDMIKPGAWIGISNAVPQDGALSAKAITISDDRRYPAR